MSWQGARGKIDQAATQSSRPSFPFPLRSPLLKSSKKSLRGGNKWWPTFSFVLSLGPDRLATLDRRSSSPFRSPVSAPVSFSVCLPLRISSRRSFNRSSLSYFFLYFGGHTIFSSNDVASPETGFDSLALCGVSLEKLPCWKRAND